MVQKQQFNNDDASWDYAELWNKFLVPARPSCEELEYLESEIKPRGKDIKLLILGSTIEYRSLCKKLGVVAYVADFDKSIYDVLTSYSNEDFNDEHFLKIDWLEIQQKNTYDVIMGHRAPNVIGKEVLGRFFRNMYFNLKDGGVFYSKSNVKFDSNVTLETLLEKWAFNQNRKYPLFSYIEVELYFFVADNEGYIDYYKARELVQEWLENKRISQEDYDFIRPLISMSSDARFRGLINENEYRDAIRQAGYKSSEWIIKDRDICNSMPIMKLVK